MTDREWISRGAAPHPAPPSPNLALAGGEFLATGLQRISLEQLDYAVAALTGMRIDIGIHEARKSLRRVRAVLRLVRDPLGDRTYRAENVALRDAGRLIGGSRDATVMVETVSGLAFLYRDLLVPGAFDVLRSHLLERDKLIRRRVSGERIDEVVLALTGARERFAAWPSRQGTSGTLDEGFSTVEAGIRRVYRRGRNRMADAYLEETPEAFHVWRKRVRYLRFQTTLLEGMWPGMQRGIVKDLAYLADALGAEHDLAELYRLLDEEPEMLPDENARHLLQGLLLRNRTRLQAAAHPVGARLYAEAPRAFTQRLGTYWEAWRPATGQVG
ncbi:MAG: CHAD domain-containing protein [Acidimicrobiia bacterium]|nr:CHAD domain-containing protein [Acidimicrobiia bacterium]